MEENLDLDESFADVIFWKLKAFLIEVIWGKEFEQFFCKCFKKVCGEKLVSMPIPRGQFVTTFSVEKDGFDLRDKFRVTLSDGSSSIYVLQEDQLIQMLYTNPTFYQAVGREFCNILCQSRYRSHGRIFLPSDGCSRKRWWAEPRSPDNAY